MVPQANLNAIRSLELKWTFAFPAEALTFARDGHTEEERWKNAWRVIKEMKGLQNLHARIDTMGRFPREAEKPLLEPLKELKGAKEYKVDVSWPHGLTKYESGPFSLRRQPLRPISYFPLAAVIH